ncbi:MAG: cation diffusion facilitator family transporter [Pseudomonadota bacterium]|nr:cation diffusion facilitator family transporter [Pseudomonadota bacterium]
MDRVKVIALSSIGVGALVLALKAGAWWLTGSSALYSDALESVVNVAASVVAAAALFYAARPADKNHPYGHDKAEFFAAVIVGVLIIVAALSIFRSGWQSWRSPDPIMSPWSGLALSLVASVINGGWAVVLGAAAARNRSAALRADARHLWSDVATSGGVLIGVGTVLATGLAWLDGAIAMIVGLHVLWSGWGVMRESVGGLMDEAPNQGIMDRTREVLNRSAEGAIEAHDLRMRLAGRTTYLEFHLVVPGSMQVAEAHAICDRVETALKAETPGLVVTIHVEPEAKAKHSGVLVL